MPPLLLYFRAYMSGPEPQARSRPAGTVLSLGVSPWQRAAVSSPAGGAPPTYGSPTIPVIPILPEPIAALDHVPGPPTGLNVGPVGVRTTGQIASVPGVTGVTVPGVGGGVVPVTVGPGPVPVVAGIVPPPAEALEREKDSRDKKRQQMINAEKIELAEDQSLEKVSRMLLLIGLFGLPLVHFIQVLYFSREILDKNSNWYVRRNAIFALFCGSVELLVALAWFVLFQAMSDRFDALSILNAGFSLANLS